MPKNQLSEVHSEVRVWVTPIDPDAAHRTHVAVNDNYMGFALKTGGEGGSDSTNNVPGFESLQWNGERYIKDIFGPLEWVCFSDSFRVVRGVASALATSQASSLSGWTVKPALVRSQGDIQDPAPFPGSPDYDLRPALPNGEPVIEWESQQGDKWERVTPARTPLWSSLHHRQTPANAAVKVKTKDKWEAGAGAHIVLDLGGVAYAHNGDPAIRLEWGNSWSLVFRGNGGAARAQLERKGANAKGALVWRSVRRFEDGPALDEKWWKSRHSITFYRLAGFLVVKIDDDEFWCSSELWRQDKSKIAPIQWKAAPLRVSIYGADCLIQLASVRFDRVASFKREVSVAAPPAEEISWTCHGGALEKIAVPGIDDGISTGFPFVDAVIESLLGSGKAQLAGLDLQDTKLSGIWREVASGTGTVGRVDYTLSMQGTRQVAPFVTAFAAEFPPTAPTPPVAPVNLRMALDSVEVESGEPERMPNAIAKLEISVPMLKQIVPDWKSVVAPFRPVRIETDPNRDGNWKTIFFGYLMPDGAGSEGYNGEHLQLTAFDPKIRLRKPAALVDGRFGPLDMSYVGDLYGFQCVQKLLGYEMGRGVARDLNGDGNGKKYLPASHYALRSATDNDSYYSSGAQEIKGFLLPPPFGDDIETWIKKIADFDHATWFYDPTLGERGAFVYGHLDRIYQERGQTVHALHENADAAPDASLSAWPILSSYSSQGLLEHAYTRVEIWGIAPISSSDDALFPAMFAGAATTALPASDPLSEAQSWPRTLLSRQEFISGRVQNEYAQSLAELIWREFDGRAPERVDFTLRDQILIARWGEKVNWNGRELRVLSSKMAWRFGDNGGRVTTITARALSGTGL